MPFFIAHHDLHFHPPSFVSILPWWMWTSRPFNGLCFLETRCCHLRRCHDWNLAPGRQTPQGPNTLINIDKLNWCHLVKFQETWSWFLQIFRLSHLIILELPHGIVPILLGFPVARHFPTYGHRGEKERMKGLTVRTLDRAKCTYCTEESTSIEQMEFSAKDTLTNTLSLAKLQVSSLSRQRNQWN